MKNLIFFCTLAICLPIAAQAQMKMQLGGKLGGGLGSYPYNETEGIAVTQKAFFAYKIGLAARVADETSTMFLETGVLYDRKGTKQEQNLGRLGSSDIVIEKTYSVSYLTIPVHVGYNFGYFYLNSGVGLSFYLSNTRRTRGLSSTQQDNTTTLDSYKSFSPCFDIGGGFNIGKKTSLGVEYSRGYKVFLAGGNTNTTEIVLKQYF